MNAVQKNVLRLSLKLSRSLSPNGRECGLKGLVMFTSNKTLMFTKSNAVILGFSPFKALKSGNAVVQEIEALSKLNPFDPLKYHLSKREVKEVDYEIDHNELSFLPTDGMISAFRILGESGVVLFNQSGGFIFNKDRDACVVGIEHDIPELLNLSIQSSSLAIFAKLRENISVGVTDHYVSMKSDSAYVKHQKLIDKSFHYGEDWANKVEFDSSYTIDKQCAVLTVSSFKIYINLSVYRQIFNKVKDLESVLLGVDFILLCNKYYFKIKRKVKI